jgi:hypothetical protein
MLPPRFQSVYYSHTDIQTPFSTYSGGQIAKMSGPESGRSERAHDMHVVMCSPWLCLYLHVPQASSGCRCRSL